MVNEIVAAGRSPATAEKTLRRMSAGMAGAVDARLIRDNPCVLPHVGVAGHEQRSEPRPGSELLVSAVAAQDASGRLLGAWCLEHRYELIVCPLLLDELAEGLRRPRFHAVITGEELQMLLRGEARLVDDLDDVPPITADPDDDYLVALAIREQVDAFVSGDSDLTRSTTFSRQCSPPLKLSLALMQQAGPPHPRATEINSGWVPPWEP